MQILSLNPTFVDMGEGGTIKTSAAHEVYRRFLGSLVQFGIGLWLWGSHALGPLLANKPISIYRVNPTPWVLV
jgi:hypothetical protein